MISRGGLGPSNLKESALEAWGRAIGQRVETPLWIAMRGPLGAGKSVMARAICRGAGVAGNIPSPSFTLVQHYKSPRGFEIHHVDLFRLRVGDPFEPLGWDELLTGSGLVLLEWADRAGDQQPTDRWEVALDYAPRSDERIVTAKRIGTAQELIEW
jgi:tRNA threonylcarbamoyladenosine biosynthesis protein TsaE